MTPMLATAVQARAMPAVRAVLPAEQDRLAATMTLAFANDPAARWAWPDPGQFLRTFLPLVTLFGGKALDHGTAHVVGDFAGVAQWLPPGVLPDDDPMAALFARTMQGAKLDHLLGLFEQMGPFHPDRPHWYLPLFGVDPARQGQGHGTILMRHALATCDRTREPAYLEATSPANRRFYERHGFRTLGEIRSADSPPMFPMLREPR